MKWYKEFLAIFFAVTMVVSLSACSGSESVSSKEDTGAVEKTTENTEPVQALNVNANNRLIYCITPPTSNPYFETMQTVAKEAGEVLGYEVRCESHDDDITKQSELFATAIEEGASFIICANADPDASIEAVQSAYDAGIGVILVDREMNQGGIASAQILSDNEKGAVEVAQYLAEQTGGQGSYAELQGLENDLNSQVRSQAFHSVLDDTEMNMVAHQSAEGNQEQGKKEAKAILQKYQDIVALVCCNDAMACGAAEAVKEAKLDHDVFIIGVDGSNDMITNIKDGLTTATALQQIDYMTRLAIEQGDTLMTAGVTGEKEEKQLIECKLITKENADKVDNFVYTE